MSESLCIDVFSDLVCPWCYIGSHRLTQALALLGSEVEAEVCYHPFFLDPSVPESGASIREMLKKKYGVEPQQLWGRVESAAAQSGLSLDLSRQPNLYPTAAAHTLIRHAHPKGTQLALVDALFAAYFQEAANIADEGLLLAVASQHGFSEAEARDVLTTPAELELTRDEATAAAQSGIRGVPFFIFGGRLAVSGAQSASVLAGAMRQALLRCCDSDFPPAEEA